MKSRKRRQKKLKTTKDFRIKKKKLGKKKRRTNETQTKFQTAQIFVNNPLTLQKKDQKQVTTFRKQTLSTLLSQCKHHNANVRRDSLIGLRELHINHRSTILRSLSSIIPTALSLIQDDHNKVRQALLLFFQTLCSNYQGKEQITPFIGIICAYISTALTSLDREVREVGLQFLEILFQSYSDISKAWIPRFVQNLIRLIRLPSNNTTKMSIRPRFEIVNNLVRFVNVLSNNNDENNMNNNSNNNNNKNNNNNSNNNNNNNSDLINKTNKEQTRNSSNNNDNKKQNNKDNTKQKIDKETKWSKSDGAQICLIKKWENRKYIQFYNTQTNTLKESEFKIQELIEILFDTWVEGSSLNNSMITRQETTKCMAGIVEILSKIDYFDNQIFWKNMFLKKYIQHILKKFPLKTTSRSNSINDNILKINLTIIQIVSKILLKYKLLNSETIKEIFQSHFLKLNQYLIDTMKHIPTVELHFLNQIILILNNFFISYHQMKDMKLILPIDDLLSSYLTLIEKINLQSKCLGVAIEFICKQLMDNTQFYQIEKVGNWIQKLPKLLWQLGAHNEKMSQIIIDSLHTLGNNNKIGNDLIKKIQPSFVTFFFVQIEKNNKTHKVFGPFKDLPQITQRNAISLITLFPNISEKLLSSILQCLPSLFEKNKIELISYIVEIINYTFVEQKIELPLFLSFLFSVLLRTNGNYDIFMLIQNCLVDFKYKNNLIQISAPFLEQNFRHSKNGTKRLIELCLNLNQNKEIQLQNYFSEILLEYIY
ncbi:hypothetical protein M0812_07749 [Anaeramoeba flamelloides]|uniref:Pre-rRNA-processing protein Ipi1 N-terminal domain-containing protein n=1 Tax=Anaeramoeba flamelloides TaxID=1746091 RepID=A0AAV8A1Z2_9EUKA|nr:hypothetical protein M0812_07749 [Anaeramoeba flamelloides]